MDGFTLGQFWDLWELFREPTLAGALAGALLGMLGVYVVPRRMVFLSASLSQTAGLGVTLAFYAQLHWGIQAGPLTGAMLLAVFVVLLLWLDQSASGHRRDGMLGLAFLIGSAGTLLVATEITTEISDIESLVFGSAVAVLPEDFRLLAWTAAAIALVHLVAGRGFMAISFDRQDARVRGLPTRGLELLLLVTLAVAIATTTRILGALPAFAFSVLPALAALRLAPNLPVAVVLGAVLGGAAGFWGYVVAFLYSWPVGPSQAAVGVALVVSAELLRQAYALAAKLLRRRPVTPA